MDQAAESGLSALQARVEGWRRRRPSATSRVPEELWNEAVRVAQVHGVHATAKALRFNYYDLKKRVVLLRSAELDAPLANRESLDAAKTAFVQLDIPTPQRSHGGGALVIELTGPRGDRMRIDAQDASGLDVVGMVQAFWRQA